MTYAVLLLVLALVLAILEFFLPSGGVLGLMATGAIIASLILAFQESETTGIVFLAVVCVVSPVVITLGLKLFPKTPVGRRLILAPSVESARQRGTAGVAEEDYTRLMGKTGKAVTPLRPSGIIEIDGQRYSAVARCEMIEKDVEIVVREVEGNSIVVESQQHV